MDISSFYRGEVFDAYEFFGAHIENGGVVFRTYAPAAANVMIAGDFSGWQPWQMYCENGVWSMWTDRAKAGDIYKYIITTREGRVSERCDPYGFGMELRPKWGSVVRDLNEYKFTDSKWIAERDKNYNKPMNIYEMHMGSWRQKENTAAGKDDTAENESEAAEERFYRYDEIADMLIPYLQEHGYTHVEFMPLAEHPVDESWGYQVTGFFAPTSRYGTAAQLMELIDRLHTAGIGAILDFVPVHFALDSYALINYDGGELYEYPLSDVSVSEWGTCNFQFNKCAAAVFMQSCADYWLTKYHFDGLRMDAISRAIYWQGEKSRGVNPNSVDFIKRMNAGLKARHGDCMLIAEDSTEFLKITAPVEYGGLGFDYKWDLGWMNDTLDYFRTPPYERKYHHHKLTFSMQYFYNELYLLEFSHDENVHGKATVVQKMWGDYEQKFPQARAMYAYMYTHPGKKLNFMGGENAQLREWDESRSQDWDILKYPLHESFSRYLKKLCALYKSRRSLYEAEYDPAAFRWIMADNAEQCCYAYIRSVSGERSACFFNFSDIAQKIRAEVGKGCILTPLLNSDEQTFSGSTPSDKILPLEADEEGLLTFEMPPFCAMIFDLKEDSGI